MNTTTTPLRAAIAAALVAGVAATAASPAGALLDRRLVLTGDASNPGGTCATANVGYAVGPTAETDDGGGYDYFGILEVDGDGTVLEHDVYRALVGSDVQALADTDLDALGETIDDRKLDIRLVDLAFAPAPGTDDSDLVVQGALASPVLLTRTVDLGQLFPECAGLPYDGQGGIASVCVPPLPNPFVDVVGTSTHGRQVICAALRGLVKGGPAGLPSNQYGPTLTTSRAQLATMVLHLIEEESGPVLVVPMDAFDDDAGSVHEGSIDALAAIGVIGGNGESGRLFFPSRPATRSEMASFMAGAWEEIVGAPLPPAPDSFDDDDGDPAEADINGLAAAGVLSGKAPGVYDPSATVTREQIATFFIRLLAALPAN